MTDLKKQVERAIGDSFIHWYNNNKGTAFVFHSLGNDPPDLIYINRNHLLPLEITTAYYDLNDAKMRWGHARKDPKAPKEWESLNPDQALMDNIGERLKEKCNGTYDKGTILVVAVYPAVTTISDVDQNIREIHIPTVIPFSSIYLTGDFPTSSTTPGGYYCWKLDGAQQNTTADG